MDNGQLGRSSGQVTAEIMARLEAQREAEAPAGTPPAEAPAPEPALGPGVMPKHVVSMETGIPADALGDGDFESCRQMAQKILAWSRAQGPGLSNHRGQRRDSGKCDAGDNRFTF